MKKIVIMAIVVFLGCFSVVQADENDDVKLQETAKKYAETIIFRGSMIASAYSSGYYRIFPDFQDWKIADVISNSEGINEEADVENPTLSQLIEKGDYQAIGKKYLNLKY